MHRVSIPTACLLLLAACATPGAAPRDAPGLAGGYHGVVIWLGEDRHDTVAVSFATEWRPKAGSDSAWTFYTNDGPQVIFGTLEGDSLVWSHGTRSNFGQIVQLAGRIEADARVRGCTLPPRRLPRYRTTYLVAAFALAPRGAPPPSAADVPVGRCGAGGR
ncbi:MAG TPA: hypothetical protein VK420_23140 [Longimicrobium sp.]|nr:hypothetical protein [Longimicrobium sp.]